MSIDALSSSLPVKEAPVFLGISITDAKIQRAALAFFAVAFFWAGSALISYGGLIGSLSLLCNIAALGATFLIFRVKDYQNPEKLKAYRQKAEEQTLAEVIKEHGLSNALKHKIMPLTATQRHSFRQKLAANKNTMIRYLDMCNLDQFTDFHTRFRKDPEYNKEWDGFFTDYLNHWSLTKTQ